MVLHRLKDIIRVGEETGKTKLLTKPPMIGGQGAEPGDGVVGVTKETEAAHEWLSDRKDPNL